MAKELDTPSAACRDGEFSFCELLMDDGLIDISSRLRVTMG